MQKRDILVLIGGMVIVAVLWMAPKETTRHVPKDETHQQFHDLVEKEGKAGKKAAEAFCQNCHNEAQIPFPADHPPKARCLFCHKLER